MVLKKEGLSKALKKGRTFAVDTLNLLSKTAGHPEPVYTYEAGGSTRRPSHFFLVRFRVPQFLLSHKNGRKDFTITGSGRCGSKQFAKSLAALEAVHRLENQLGMDRDGLRKKVDDYVRQQKEATAQLEALPIAEEIPDVSWAAVPIDPALSAALPATREGRISFLRDIEDCPKALLVAKAMTLACQDELPDIKTHGNVTDEGVPQRFANIKSKSDTVKDAQGHVGEDSFGADYHTTVRLALQSVYVQTMTKNHNRFKEWTRESNRLKKRKVAHNKRYRGNTKKSTPKAKITFQDLLDSVPYDESCENIQSPKTRILFDALMKQPESSFGMARLLVKWPKHQFSAMKELVDKLDPPAELWEGKHANRNVRGPRGQARDQEYHATRLKERLEIFRHHQAKTPLPIDDIESRIPHNADVTILCGGTGSGKTTRYPLMVSLLDDSPPAMSPSQLVADQEDHSSTVFPKMHMVVAQPRRLACQAAAKRVALEQGYKSLSASSSSCPIGYSIRFESKPSSPEEDRTIDFQTIGVVLATAASDPLLSHVTHLCIDEVHERNADMDLLLALAKKIQHQRKLHPTLPPLKIILMSATLDSSQWEDYFSSDVDDINVARVAVPDATRYPIEIVHHGDQNFPQLQLPKKEKRLSDEQRWKATAQLALSIVKQGKLQDGGSILCFLPGMEEIQTVERILVKALKKSRVLTKPKILILHSSVSSGRQARIFEPGPKIILSTNIAETSVTIPDVKIIVDPGRERQSTMLDDTSMLETTTVVGSQLVTVDIAQSAAKQRAGRAGRVAPGTCYRLYTKDAHASLPAFSEPEMLRMDLAQLVLHSISLCDPKKGDPLGLISGAPDPPPDYKLQQAVSSLVEQGLVAFDQESDSDSDSDCEMYCDEDLEGLTSDEKKTFLAQFEDSKGEEDNNEARNNDIELESKQDSPTPAPQLTYLGKAVSSLPASPRIGRMIMLGLALRAVEPALTIAALLSVPKVFTTANPPGRGHSYGKSRPKSCSDVIEQVEQFQRYEEMSPDGKARFPGGREYAQVSKVRRQLAKTIGDLGGYKPLEQWNQNGDRLGAQAALICAVSQHVASLADGRGAFATRDCASTAKMHPSSVNFSHDRRAHWYVYNELRKTSSPFLHVTSAASPLELALFSNGGPRTKLDEDIEVLQKMLNWTHVADQWIPVSVSGKHQRKAFVRLKEIVNHEMLNEVSRDSSSFRENEDYETLVALVMSAVEQQRRDL